MYLSLLQCGWHTVTFFQKITAWNGGKKSNFTVEKADKKVPYPGIKVNINSHVMLITYILHVLDVILDVILDNISPCVVKMAFHLVDFLSIPV